MPDTITNWWPDDLELREIEIALDELLPFPTAPEYTVLRRDTSPAMQDALVAVAACGRASRYAEQQTGSWFANPTLYRRIHRWVMTNFL